MNVFVVLFELLLALLIVAFKVLLVLLMTAALAALILLPFLVAYFICEKILTVDFLSKLGKFNYHEKFVDYKLSLSAKLFLLTKEVTLDKVHSENLNKASNSMTMEDMPVQSSEHAAGNREWLETLQTKKEL